MNLQKTEAELYIHLENNLSKGLISEIDFLNANETLSLIKGRRAVPIGTVRRVGDKEWRKRTEGWEYIRKNIENRKQIHSGVIDKFFGEYKGDWGRLEAIDPNHGDIIIPQHLSEDEKKRFLLSKVMNKGESFSFATRKKLPNGKSVVRHITLTNLGDTASFHVDKDHEEDPQVVEKYKEFSQGLNHQIQQIDSLREFYNKTGNHSLKRQADELEDKVMKLREQNTKLVLKYPFLKIYHNQNVKENNKKKEDLDRPQTFTKITPSDNTGVYGPLD